MCQYNVPNAHFIAKYFSLIPIGYCQLQCTQLVQNLQQLKKTEHVNRRENNIIMLVFQSATKKGLRKKKINLINGD